MRKVILNVAVSLDGYIEGPNGEYDWCFTDQDYGMKDFLQRIDTLFMGRKTFQMAGGAMFDKKKLYVFSNTLANVPDGEVVNGDVAAGVRKIKEMPGRDIWLFGGAALTTSLMNAGLVDELSLAVHPILLGAGKPLFQGIANRVPVWLLDAKTYTSGITQMRYDVPINPLHR